MTFGIIPESDSKGRAVCQFWLQGGKRALASIKDRLSLAHCFRDQSSQVVQGFLGSTLQSPAATRHWGHEAWLS